MDHCDKCLFLAHLCKINNAELKELFSSCYVESVLEVENGSGMLVPVLERITKLLQNWLSRTSPSFLGNGILE